MNSFGTHSELVAVLAGLGIEMDERRGVVIPTRICVDREGRELYRTHWAHTMSAWANVYRPRRKGWHWREQVPDQQLHKFTYKETSKGLERSIPLPAAHYFGDIDPSGVQAAGPTALQRIAQDRAHHHIVVSDEPAATLDTSGAFRYVHRAHYEIRDPTTRQIVYAQDLRLVLSGDGQDFTPTIVKDDPVHL